MLSNGPLAHSLCLYFACSCRDGVDDTTPRVFVVHTMNYVVADGSSNWMEGFILICASLHPLLSIVSGPPNIQR